MDSPPIGLFPDALAFSKIADDVIFVTRYGKVARRAAKGLLENLEESGCNILGVVLNDLPARKSTDIITPDTMVMVMDTTGISTITNTMGNLRKKLHRLT